MVLTGGVFGFQGFDELDTPFRLKLRDAQQGRSHPGDYNTGDDAKGPLPDGFRAAPMVFPKAIKGANEARTDTDAGNEAESSAEPYLLRVNCGYCRGPFACRLGRTNLSDKLLISHSILLVA